MENFLKACEEFTKGPDEFGYDAMADMFHHFADEAYNEEIKKIVGWIVSCKEK